MKRGKSVLLAILIALTILGCATNDQQSAVNSLFKLQNTVDTAYASYLNEVASGAISTNSVAEISRHYRSFQSAFAIASALSALYGPVPPNVELSNTVSQVLLAIDAEKVKKK